MEVKELLNEGLKREFSINISAEAIKEAKQKKLDEIQKEMKMEGFRKGKAPKDLIERKYGMQVMKELLDENIDKTSHDLIHKENLRIASRPNIELVSFDQDSGLEYKFKCEIFPNVVFPDFSKITMEKLIPQLSEEDLKEILDRIAKANAEPVAVEDENYAAQNGDVVVINFLGKMDGVEFPGGKAENHSLELGSNSFIPGFEAQLVGSKKNDEKLVKLQFPVDYHAKDLAGKDVEFEVKINEVKTVKVPEINEEFLKNSPYKTLEEFKEKLTSEATKEYEEAVFTHSKKELFDKLAEVVDFPIPESIFNEEFEGLWKKVQEMPEEEKAGKTEEELKKEYQQLTERRVRLGILLKDYGAENNVTVSRNEINDEIYKTARQFPGQEHSVVEYYRNNPQLLDMLKGPILEDKVVRLILEKVTSTERTVSTKDIMEILKKDNS